MADKDAQSDPEHWGPDKVLRDELTQLRPLTDSSKQNASEEKQMASMSPEKPGKPSGPDDVTLDPDPVREETYRLLNDGNLLALCLSGGGIRSASIGLGVLQALARQDRLACLDYISTVSGGGYIGAWLSAWCARDPKGISAVQTLIQQEYCPLKQEYEAKEVRALREFTSYLTPQNGLFSSDTWSGIATVLRNLTLNWILFLPAFLFLVWLPKFWVFVFDQLGQILATEAPSSIAAIGNSGLAICAIGLYGYALIFASRQLAIQDEQSGPLREPGPYGAGQVSMVNRSLAPSFLAASIASIMLSHWGEAGSIAWPAAFAGAVALLWSVPYFCYSVKVGRDLGAAPSGLWGALQWAGWPSLARFVAGGAIGMALLAGFIALHALNPGGGARYYVAFGLPCCFLAHLGGTTLFVGLTSRIRDHDAIREWSARAGGLFAMAALGWGLYALLVLWDPLQDGPFTKKQLAGLPDQLLHGIVAALGGTAGVAGSLLGRSPSTGGAKPASGGNLNRTRIAQLAGLVFFVAFVFELSRLFDFLVRYGVAKHIIGDDGLSQFLFHLAMLTCLVLWIALASYFINVNKFSLHAFYRNRLIRAYLGASNHQRRPSAFTGFDEGDNMPMAVLQTPDNAPIHVVNMALNLVHGKNLAWQERKASSFSATRLAVGNPHLGYRPAAKYGMQISLGTVMAISGAAVSPNMGYHSSPLLALLMTLFNLRLGWWLGNPARTAWRQSGPAFSDQALLAETLGLTDDQGQYVYLSDGGHFENLGIYEMVRRRCRTIIAVDAGADPDFKFEDLGNAIRKARIDQGVEIAFDPPRPAGKDAASKPTRLRLVNRPKRPASLPYCAIGTIKYPEAGAPTGTLIYIKAAIHGDEPEDIGSYAAANPTFPHEATADQFFRESQFESYRRLGLHIGLSVFPVSRTGALRCGRIRRGRRACHRSGRR